jgi:hypothetical protein
LTLPELLRGGVVAVEGCDVDDRVAARDRPFELGPVVELDELVAHVHARRCQRRHDVAADEARRSADVDVHDLAGDYAWSRGPWLRQALERERRWGGKRDLRDVRLCTTIQLCNVLLVDVWLATT